MSMYVVLSTRHLCSYEPILCNMLGVTLILPSSLFARQRVYYWLLKQWAVDSPSELLSRAVAGHTEDTSRETVSEVANNSCPQPLLRCTFSYEVSRLLRCGTVSSETSVHTSSTRRHIPDDRILHSHRRESLRSCIRSASLRSELQPFITSDGKPPWGSYVYSNWNCDFTFALCLAGLTSNFLLPAL
jgi:hypothetical protein